MPLLVWSAWTVQRGYYDPSRIDPAAALRTALDRLSVVVPELFVDARPEGALHVTVRAASRSFEPGPLPDLVSAAERLEEILVYVQSVLDLPPEKLHELEYAAVNGLMLTLDPHTVLLPPESFQDLGVRTRGRFGGIGAEIRAERRRIRVVRVLPEGPAERAGLRDGDMVLEIDGRSTVNMRGEEAQQLLRGPVGEPVELRARRGKRAVEITVVREQIRIPALESARLPGGVGYVAIASFQEDTNERLRAALVELAQGPEKLRGLVLDVRGNSGGLLAQASKVVDAFVDSGALVIVRSAAGREVDPAHEQIALDPAVPIVVLVDEDSASASEILAGGLSAHGRAVVVGRGTFGKGTVQMLQPSQPYGEELALKLTVAEYRVEGDRRIQSVGVVPDVELLPVELADGSARARYYDTTRFERQRERFRVAHLPSAAHDLAGLAIPKAAHRLRILWDPALPEGLGEVGGPAADVLRDPEVRAARAVAQALAPAGADRAERTRHLAQVVARLAQDSEARIVAALSRRGVDWRGPEGDAPTLAVTATVEPAGPVEAGAAVGLRVAVTNEGVTPAHRVHLRTSSDKEEFDAVELLVGRVGPGQTVTRTVQLGTDPGRRDFDDTMAVDVFAGEPGAEPLARVRVPVQVRGPAPPAFRVDAWVVDEASWARRSPRRPAGAPIPGQVPFAPDGNGDGMMSPGEEVLLVVRARNVGEGQAEHVRATLRNLSGEQGLLEEGAIELGSLAPGQEARGAFGITVSPEADPTRPFTVELAVGDLVRRVALVDALEERILPEGRPFLRRPARLRAKEAVRLYAGAHPAAMVVATRPAGAELPALGTVGSWWVVPLSGGRRVFVPADLVEERPGRGRPARVELTWRLDPPRITLEPPPLRTKAATVTLRGRATDEVRVADVVLTWRPPGRARLERKVAYRANPARSGDEARALDFEAEVPLEPGSNWVQIGVRDDREAERVRSVWILREP